MLPSEEATFWIKHDLAPPVSLELFFSPHHRVPDLVKFGKSIVSKAMACCAVERGGMWKLILRAGLLDRRA